MRTINERARQARKAEIMEACFACYAESGLNGVGIKAIAGACGCTPASLYQYFENLDDLIIQSTAYCMSRVEDAAVKSPGTGDESAPALWCALLLISGGAAIGAATAGRRRRDSAK